MRDARLLKTEVLTDLRRAIDEAKKMMVLEEIEWLLTDYAAHGEGEYSRGRALELAGKCRDWLGIKRDPVTLAIFSAKKAQ